jgi:hypothetical protein
VVSFLHISPPNPHISISLFVPYPNLNLTTGILFDEECLGLL